jgi:membrane protease YdiL (CAAX protease family)
MPGSTLGSPHDRYWYRLALFLSEEPLPPERTAPLLADVADARITADLIHRDDGIWLVLFTRTAEERHAANKALTPVLQRHGFTRTRLRFTSLLADRMHELLTEPAAVVARLPVALALGGAGFILTGWLLRRRNPEPAWEAARAGAARSGIIGLGLGVAAAAIVTGLELLMDALGAPVQEQAWVRAVANQGGMATVALVSLIVVVAPIGEEIFFRGHVFRYLAARGFRTTAYVYSAGIFAAAHGNLAGLPAYLLYGLVLAWSFDRWRSLVVPIVVHATVNATAVGLLVWRAAAGGP